VSIIDPALKDGAMDISIVDFHELIRLFSWYGNEV